MNNIEKALEGKRRKSLDLPVCIVGEHTTFRRAIDAQKFSLGCTVTVIKKDYFDKEIGRKLEYRLYLKGSEYNSFIAANKTAVGYAESVGVPTENKEVQRST